jgi:hypothetical protein
MNAQRRAYLSERDNEIRQLLQQDSERTANEHEDFRNNDPKWKALRLDPTYQRITRELSAAIAARIKALGRAADPSDMQRFYVSYPDVRKWQDRKDRFEKWYGVHKGDPCDLANTPELFQQWIGKRGRLHFGLLAAGTPDGEFANKPANAVIEHAYRLAVFLSGKHGMPIPPELPALPVTPAAGDSYLLKLSEWSARCGDGKQPAPDSTDWVSRSEAARRLNIHPSNVTKIAKLHPEIAEAPQRGSRVEFIALRALHEEKRAERLRDEEIRARAEKRVTDDVRTTEEQLKEDPPTRLNRRS